MVVRVHMPGSDVNTTVRRIYVGVCSLKSSSLMCVVLLSTRIRKVGRKTELEMF